MKPRPKKARTMGPRYQPSLPPPSATWFDLPQEVRTIIFGMVVEADQIVYVPRDRRLKKDWNWNRAHHFHNLLLVSKTFVSPEDLAFAVLRVCELNFYSFNELQRFCKEVKPLVKENVLKIHLHRGHKFNRGDPERDSFDGFSGMETLLQSNFPLLKKVIVSAPRRCGDTGFGSWIDAPVLSSLAAESVLDKLEKDFQQTDRRWSFSIAQNLVADFAGNYATRCEEYRLTRPHAWLRNLVAYSDKYNIDLTFKIQVCLMGRSGTTYTTGPFMGGHIRSCCWLCRVPWDILTQLDLRYVFSLHLEAQMSTKDWMLKLNFNGREFESHQKLAYDMLHVSGNKGTGWWLDLLDDARNGA